ncbi:MAG TPA: hypothetical protein VNY83_05385 [Solirubrobacterales bacterium]|jgi:hypothetical protein|nr:hypothetical protein [Solirubrobacterales bacterium]
MGRALRRPSPALFVSLVALFAALGGTVYAAAKTDGRSIKVKSLPGNRLKLGSVPGNRLKPGAIGAGQLAPNSIGAQQIDEATLGQVPSAVHADNADTALEAQTALAAVNAINANTVNGHSAGCLPDTQLFAGACWQSKANGAATAPNAALTCALDGGALPEALQLAAFAQQPGVKLDGGDEWSSEISSYTAPNAYSVATVSASAIVGSALVNGGMSETRKYRCVFQLVT